MAHNNEQADPELRKNDLAGEYKYGDAGQLLIAFLFAIAWICDSFIFEYTTFLNQIIPNSIRLPIGICFLSISGFIAIKGMSIVFGGNREHPSVIRKSIFGIVRHPIYLSEILLYFGLLVLSLSFAAAVIWIFALLFLHYIARYEEKLCVKRYGEEYNRYIHDVPMWIPRFWIRQK
jgi:protein-S-isoprenylcysteine O-methyltransferase Ste14